MPFWYHLPVPELADAEQQPLRIKKWLLDIGSEVHQGTRIVIVKAGNSEYAVSANGDGFLREKLFPAGASVEPSSPIAVIAADGENIPYERPYSLAERLT
jgi:pyruvate/2-oxoglutarate dehydrogenase complex dihydrolipoamide acyltransferase (E2) component